MHKSRVSSPRLCIQMEFQNVHLHQISSAKHPLAPDCTTANARFVEVINIFLLTLKRRLGFSESLGFHFPKNVALYRLVVFVSKMKPWNAQVWQCWFVVPFQLHHKSLCQSGWMVQHVQLSGHLFLLAFPQILVGEKIETSKTLELPEESR